MDVAGALLPFTHVVRPELTIHVQEVLTQAERDVEAKKTQIPEIKEPVDDEKHIDVDARSVKLGKGVKSDKCEVKNTEIVIKNGRKGNPA